MLTCCCSAAVLQSGSTGPDYGFPGRVSWTLRCPPAHPQHSDSWASLLCSDTSRWGGLVGGGGGCQAANHAKVVPETSKQLLRLQVKLCLWLFCPALHTSHSRANKTCRCCSKIISSGTLIPIEWREKLCRRILAELVKFSSTPE